VNVRVNVIKNKCYLIPWYKKDFDPDFEIYYNYAGWLWFQFNWYSLK